LLDIIAFASVYKLPIITDEIYGELVFSSETFHPLAAVNASAPRPVPVITVNGIAKRWLVPGWRLGWVTFSDPASCIRFNLRQKLKDTCSISFAPCALVQAALPTVLANTPSSFYENVITILERNARVLQDGLEGIHGLKVFRPRGSLYCMVAVDTKAFEGITNDWDFVQKLVWEEAVFASTYCLVSDRVYNQEINNRG
jgi:tyrosine aminotransferase